MFVQPGLCRTRSETRTLVFSQPGPNDDIGLISLLQNNLSFPEFVKHALLYFISIQIVVMPNTESIPIFQGPGLPEYMKNEYIRYRCRELQLHVHRPELPELCKKHIFSISAVIHQTALGEIFY